MILGMICAACMTVRSSANLTLSENRQNYTRDRVGATDRFLGVPRANKLRETSCIQDSGHWHKATEQLFAKR